MFLAIEIGGTKLQLGLGAGDGSLAALWRGAVDTVRGAEGIREQITGQVSLLLAQAGIPPTALRGAGVGFGGPVDDASQSVIKSHQIDGWDGFPLADWLGDFLGLPVTLGNDADVAGLAEVLFGAGRGFSPVFYITVGSGIGGGLILDGEIYRGCGRGAAEIGHLRVGFAGNERSILEHAASGWAIERHARAEIGRNAAGGSALRQLADRLTTRDLAAAAAHGDASARALLTRPLDALAEGICQVIALLCPRRIVIGGGVALIGESEFFEPLRRLVAEKVFAPFASCFEIVPAALGEEVVVHGALALARKRFGVR
jgi:glucokinase